MAALRRSKRVTWPSDGNLCKVKLFLPEDEPLKLGRGTEDDLQEKTTYLLQGGGINELNISIPPGFESAHRNPPETETPQIPLIQWQRPHKLVLNKDWRVAAGEESEEAYLENVRVQGVLEAIYPRPSSIPPNPLVNSDVQFCSSIPDDLNVPLVPITDPEDDIVVQVPEPEVGAAANVAYAIMKSGEEGSLIDPELLVKLLREPSMVSKLLSHYNAPEQAQPCMVPMSPLESSAKAAPTQVKDVNYYKSLIHLHGGDKREALDVKKADFKGKPCIYFNTTKGCRNGAACLFLHDVHVVTSKRIKLDRGVVGRF